MSSTTQPPVLLLPQTKTALFYLGDEAAQLASFRELFSNEYDVRATVSLEEARRELEGCVADVVISDQRGAAEEGIEFLRLASRLCPDALRVLVSPHVAAGDLLSQLRSGIVHCFVPQPWSYESMRRALERAPQLADSRVRAGRSDNERRSAPRHPVRLKARVLIVATGAEDRGNAETGGEKGDEAVHTLSAYTYDVSESGVALLIPAEEMAALDALGGAYLMRFVLGLSTGAVELTVRAVRQEWLGGSEYLVGAEIVNMSGRDRVLYMQYVRGLVE